MKKRNVLMAVRSAVDTVFGRNPNRQIILCRIAGIGSNKVKVPQNFKKVDKKNMHFKKSNHNKMLARRRG